jgi:hypothetical protein
MKVASGKIRRNVSATADPAWAISHHRVAPDRDWTTAAIVDTRLRMDFAASADGADPPFSMIRHVSEAKWHTGRSPVPFVQATVELADKTSLSSSAPE